MSDTKPRKQKHKDPKPQTTPGSAERLKTVVRRLPPNLPEAVFWQSVQAWVTEDTVTWKSYFPGKFRTKRANKEGVPSRAYIAFKNPDLVARFSREYDGHVFRDKAGNESQAVVEFAPFQKTPADKKKADARNNTIDRDDDYLAFLERLAGRAESPPPAAPPQSLPAPTTTPLLEALKVEKLAQKDRETILRSHAHYKDAKREDAKKKPAPPPPSAPPVPLSKKARKAAAAAAAAASTAPPVDAPKQPATPAPSTPARQRARERQTQPSAPVSEDAGQRKTRPVVGLGRHFEAALSGAVAVSPPAPDRKRREADKGKRREDPPPAPSILQRPEEDVVAVSPKVAGGEAAGSGVPAAARAPRRPSRKGRGRGG